MKGRSGSLDILLIVRDKLHPQEMLSNTITCGLSAEPHHFVVPISGLSNLIHEVRSSEVKCLTPESSQSPGRVPTRLLPDPSGSVAPARLPRI